jgi:hypothetical protein
MTQAGTPFWQAQSFAQKKREYAPRDREKLTQTLLVAKPEEAISLLKARQAYFTAQMGLCLHFPASDQWMTYAPGSDTLVGRTTPDQEQPDLDLGPYGAVKNGVSRRHIRLIRSSLTLMIEDLGTLNGTFLNGERLPHRQPTVLCDGDELRLGLLEIRIAFERL